MVILRRLPELGEEVKLLPWCLGVVRVLCLKRSAREARSKDRSLDAHLEERGHPDALINSEDNPAELASRESDREELARGIQSLEPLYREVLLLRDIEGLSATETALVVDASVSAVKSRLHRARADLRVALSAQTPPPPLPDDCPDIRRVFSEHLEGDLKPSLCAEMESHVRGCLICARECDELKATMSICSSTPSKLPAELALQLKARIKAWLERNPTPSSSI
jgi:RNA polymerase sigma-70 factor (ECF subfamily)